MNTDQLLLDLVQVSCTLLSPQGSNLAPFRELLRWVQKNKTPNCSRTCPSKLEILSTPAGQTAVVISFCLVATLSFLHRALIRLSGVTRNLTTFEPPPPRLILASTGSKFRSYFWRQGKKRPDTPHRLHCHRNQAKNNQKGTENVCFKALLMLCI